MVPQIPSYALCLKPLLFLPLETYLSVAMDEAKGQAHNKYYYFQ